MLRFKILLTHVFAFPLGSLKNFLILALSIVSEPALDLPHLQTRFRRQISLILRLNVRMIDVVEEPFLENACLVWLKSLHSIHTVILNFLYGTL